MKNMLIYVFVILLISLVIIFAFKKEVIVIEDNFSEICEYVINQKNLTNVTYCNTQEYFIEDEGKIVYFLTIWYELCKQPLCTEGGGCPDIQCSDFYTAIIEDSTIIDFSEFREDMLGMTIRNQIGPNCIIIDKDIDSYVPGGEKQNYKWKVFFINENMPYCVLEGYALIGEDSYDLSNVTAKNLEIDCDNENVAKDMCLIKQGSQGGNCDSLKDINNACLYLKADSEKSLETCNIISDDEELTDLCYYTLAIKLKDVSICHLRNWLLGSYYSNNCEFQIENG